MKGIVSRSKGVSVMHRRRKYSFNLTVVTWLLLIIGFTLLTEPNKPPPPHVVTAKRMSQDRGSFYSTLRINGTNLGNIIIDTGASDTIISTKLATKARLSWDDGQSVNYTLADNSVTECKRIVTIVNINNIVRITPVSVCPKGSSLLGMSFLAQTKLHLENGKMTIQ
jgi:clan AA aspartic protease (TIGR02281 family)